MRRSVGSALLLLGLAVPGVASAQLTFNNCVALPGATTIINPPLISSAFFRGPHLEPHGAAPVPVSIIGRQPLNFFVYDQSKKYVPILKVRFLDNGSESQVRVTVKRQDFQGSQGADLVVFDSNDLNLWAASSAYQTTPWLGPPASACATFDPLANLYFLQVELSKTGTAGTPSLHSIQACLLEC
jgi:hypothetical protein